MAQFGDGTVGRRTRNSVLLLFYPQTAYLAGMPLACHCPYMANIQVKNIPEKLHNRLRRYARQQDCTLGEIILEAIEREVARREWHKRFSGRAMIVKGLSLKEKLKPILTPKG